MNLPSACIRRINLHFIRSEDPRVIGPDKDIFDSYPRYMHMREFPEPDRLD